MISNSIHQGFEELMTQFLELDLDTNQQTLELPELHEVFLISKPNCDYPVWDDLLEGLELPALCLLDPVYGSYEL